MMRLIWISLLALSATVSGVPVSARDPVKLQPISPWNLHYAPDRCRLVREFGDVKSSVAIVLDSYEPGNYLRAMIVGKALERHGLTGLEKVSLRFGPHEEASDVELVSGSVGIMPALIVNDSIRIVPLSKIEQAHADSLSEKHYVSFDPPVDPRRVAAVSSLEIRYRKNRELVLMIGSMEKPLALLESCTWETVESWGLDVEQQKTLSRKPVGVGVPWFRSSDYPTAMLNAGHQGIIRSRVMVDAGGKPTACHIQESTRPKEFDDTVCRALMKRAKFEPALDAEGTPVPSFWTQTIRFRME